MEEQSRPVVYSPQRPPTAPTTLYHGTPAQLKAGDWLLPHETVTHTGEAGSFVFATERPTYAALYGFHGAALLISENIDRSTFNRYVLLSPAFCLENPGDSFAPLRQRPAILASVPAASFVATGHEWVSPHPAPILTAQSFVLEDLVRQGVQVFAVRDPSLTKEELKSLPPRTVTFSYLEDLTRQNRLDHINARPAYASSPLARIVYQPLKP